MSLISLIPETCYCSQRCNVKTLAIHLKYSLKNYTTPLVMKVDQKMMNVCHLCPIILLHEFNFFFFFRKMNTLNTPCYYWLKHYSKGPQIYITFILQCYVKLELLHTLTVYIFYCIFYCEKTTSINYVKCATVQLLSVAMPACLSSVADLDLLIIHLQHIFQWLRCDQHDHSPTQRLSKMFALCSQRELEN